MENKLKVLITACSGPGAVGIIHSLRNHPKREIHIVAGSVEDIENIGYELADEKIQIPFSYDEKFIEKMIFICKNKNIDLIIPAFSDEIEILSKNIEDFNKNNIKILSPNSEIVSKVHNKNLMLRELKRANTKYYPEFLEANNITDLKNSCIKMGYPKRKICIKPARCNGGSRGFYIISEDYNRERTFFTEKNANICSLDELLLKLKGVDTFPTILVMEYLEGKEFGVDLVARQGKIVKHIIRERLNPTVAGMEMRAKIIENTLIDETIKNIVKDLKLDSILSVDLRFDKENNKPYLLEVNPRQGAYIGFTSEKVNLLAMAIDLKFGDFKNKEDYFKENKNVIGVRYFGEFIISDDKRIFCGKRSK